MKQVTLMKIFDWFQDHFVKLYLFFLLESDTCDCVVLWGKCESEQDSLVILLFMGWQ